VKRGPKGIDWDGMRDLATERADLIAAREGCTVQAVTHQRRRRRINAPRAGRLPTQGPLASVIRKVVDGWPYGVALDLVGGAYGVPVNTLRVQLWKLGFRARDVNRRGMR
jgi:hypothetical protein